MLSRFHLILKRNWQTDGRTDGLIDLLYQYLASVCWRAIKTVHQTSVKIHQLKFKCNSKIRLFRFVNLDFRFRYSSEANKFRSQYHLRIRSTPDEIKSKMHKKIASGWGYASDQSFLKSKRGAYWDRLCRDVVGRLSRTCTVAKRCILGL